jgi:hypothetical protein
MLGEIFLLYSLHAFCSLATRQTFLIIRTMKAVIFVIPKASIQEYKFVISTCSNE